MLSLSVTMLAACHRCGCQSAGPCCMCWLSRRHDCSFLFTVSSESMQASLFIIIHVLFILMPFIFWTYF